MCPVRFCFMMICRIKQSVSLVCKVLNRHQSCYDSSKKLFSQPQMSYQDTPQTQILCELDTLGSHRCSRLLLNEIITMKSETGLYTAG